MIKFSKIPIQSVFSEKLAMDPIAENYSRQVFKSFGSFVMAKKPSKPLLIIKSDLLLNDLNLQFDEEEEFLEIVSGSKNFENFESFAMCYGGHQFGNWAGQLGDGRAINIGETFLNNNPWAFQLKGAGPTPYSRGSDGLAVLRSSIREFLCSEAMHTLGIPTTRALSLVLSGDMVTRDKLYNGNTAEEKGAIVCRVAPSFLRFGSFEIFTARNERIELKQLVDFTIENHFQKLGVPSKETYLKFFAEVAKKTVELIVHWQRVGFIHGVMNTDNLSILGLTIDYGPYGWVEDFNPNWTPNTTDSNFKRYKFGNQRTIAIWNLTQLANAIYPLVNEAKPFHDILTKLNSDFENEYQAMLCAKIGFKKINEKAILLNEELLNLMHKSEIDMTIFYRELSEINSQNPSSHLTKIIKASYLTPDNFGEFKFQWESWLTRYVEDLNSENWDQSERIYSMKLHNPKYVLRNWMAQLAIDDAENGDYLLLNELHQLLLKPYEEQPTMEKWFTKRPEWAKKKFGCSMLSCSS